MRSVASIILLLFIQVIGLSQPCLPDGITFTTQAQIDSFQINYPGCTEIEGYVYVTGNNISNLNGLNNLTSIGGHLSICGTDTLLNLNGLESLTTIGESLTIGFYDWGWNSSLTSIASLSSLDSVGEGISISANLNLISLAGLEGITTLQDLGIHFNNSLVNLQGIENITHIQGELAVAENALLTSLTELENLLSIEGMLYIEGNALINSLTGLHNIDAGSISDLWIGGNVALSSCEVQSICDYLASPNGNIYIGNNAPGCNSPDEVDSACAYLAVPSVVLDDICDVSPNPFTTSTTLSYTLDKPYNVQFTFYNVQGQIVNRLQERQDTGVQKLNWNAEGFPAGMYYFRIQAGDKVGGGKMVKMSGL